MSISFDLTALTSSLSPLFVTVLNEAISNKIIAFVTSAVVIFVAIFVAIYSNCKIKSGKMDASQMLIDASILSIAAIVFSFLYSIAGMIPLGKIIRSIIGLVIAMVVAYGVYISYYFAKTTTNCAQS